MISEEHKKMFKEGDLDFRYQMLGRLQMDCAYYLGYGCKDESRLWAKNVEDHIDCMKYLYKYLEPKPEWLTLADIENYHSLMK